MKRKRPQIKVQPNAETKDAIKKMRYKLFFNYNSDEKKLTGERFLHYKGDVYQIICISFDSESKYAYVVYRSEKDNNIYHRDYDDFFGYVKNGERRFVRFSPDPILKRFIHWLMRIQ